MIEGGNSPASMIKQYIMEINFIGGFVTNWLLYEKNTLMILGGNVAVNNNVCY